jgi:nucleoside-diphosphate-sugar epimerase
MVQGLKGTLPPLTSPESAHDFVWIDDVVDACLLCAERRNSEKGIIYNVGSGSQISLREVICKAKSILGFEDEPRWGSLPAHQGENSVWVSDHRRISKDLGWEPKISFDQGLSKMAHWITSTPSMNEFYSNFRA